MTRNLLYKSLLWGAERELFWGIWLGEAVFSPVAKAVKQEMSLESSELKYFDFLIMYLCTSLLQMTCLFRMSQGFSLSISWITSEIILVIWYLLITRNADFEETVKCMCKLSAAEQTQLFKILRLTKPRRHFQSVKFFPFVAHSPLGF